MSTSVAVAGTPSLVLVICKNKHYHEEDVVETLPVSYMFVRNGVVFGDYSEVDGQTIIRYHVKASPNLIHTVEDINEWTMRKILRDNPEVRIARTHRRTCIHCKRIGR